MPNMQKKLSKYQTSKITVREDYIRKDLGDLTRLITAYQTDSIINPPVIRSNGLLVTGLRRLTAAKEAGIKEIDVIIDDNISEKEAEIAENRDRKDLTFAEKLEVAAKIEQQISVLGELKGKNKQDIEKTLVTKCGTVPQVVERFLKFEGKTRDFVAEESGIGSGKTYDKIKVISANAIPEVQQALSDRIITVNRAYRISQEKQKKQLTSLNESIEDIDTDTDGLNNYNKERRKAKRKKKAHIPDSPTAEPIYNVIRVSPDWANELETDIRELPVADYVSSTGIVCLGCPNNKIATAVQVLDAWGFTYKALVTAYNVKGKEENHREYINQMTSHVVIGQIDAEICGARVTQIPPVYNRQNPAESLCDIIAELCPDKKDTRLDMSSTAPRTGWKVWKIDYADPCVLCKAAHPDCDKCCATCKKTCNAQQACRVQKPIDHDSKKD